MSYLSPGKSRHSYHRKIVELTALCASRDQARRSGKTVIHCHGCFDIVHPGHIQHLQFARSLGDVLLVSIQVDLQDESVLVLQEDLAERIVASGASGVVIDISAVEIVDSFIGRMFATIASLSKVLDAETVVVGMRPAVAITLTELGLSLRGVRTALNAEKGLELLNGSA